MSSTYRYMMLVELAKVSFEILDMLLYCKSLAEKRNHYYTCTRGFRRRKKGFNDMHQTTQ